MSSWYQLSKTQPSSTIIFLTHSLDSVTIYFCYFNLMNLYVYCNNQICTMREFIQTAVFLYFSAFWKILLNHPHGFKIKIVISGKIITNIYLCQYVNLYFTLTLTYTSQTNLFKTGRLYTWLIHTCCNSLVIRQPISDEV